MTKLSEAQILEVVDRAEEELRDRLRAAMDRYGIPLHMRESVEAYVLRGRPVGSFLTAVFEDKLVEAYARADQENIAAMRGWALLMYDKIPMPARGRENVARWIEAGGQRGLWIRQMKGEGDGKEVW